jgi:hypothetical protein
MGEKSSSGGDDKVENVHSGGASPELTTPRSGTSRPPPRWACPPTQSSSISGRASCRSDDSLETDDDGSHVGDPKREKSALLTSTRTGRDGQRAQNGWKGENSIEANEDFDEEVLGRGEWVEIIKGAEGRIAVKSTETDYEVMVWLPGFK